MRSARIWLGLLQLVNLGSVLALSRDEKESQRPFTVKDSIEISYIVNPAASTVVEIREAQPKGVPIISPDGKYILLITQKGVLSNNTLEATIWLFERKGVLDYASIASTVKPMPKALVTFSARSNTPVISSVRWLDDSKRVAFLGKRDSAYQQLFIADVNRQSVTAITSNDAYVTAYDLIEDTITYTTLIRPEDQVNPADGFVDVTGKEVNGILSLLFSRPKELEDLEEGELTTYPSALHVRKNGKEIPLTFKMNGSTLRLFIPVLSLSPDGKSLITVAPVHDIPSSWAEYQPNFPSEFFRLRPGNKDAVSEENPWKASQYVLVNLETGLASPLLDAPAGRCLVYWAATKAIWSSNSRRAILSNTFLPIDGAKNTAERAQRAESPAVAILDILSKTAEPITFREISPRGSKKWYRLSDITWNEARQEVGITYDTGPEAGNKEIETYRSISNGWTKDATDAASSSASGQNVELSVDQGLNQPPVLSGRVPSKPGTVIWDPNPQLQGISLGKTSVYHWRDSKGKVWSGILALPPDYNPHVLYPLVIQTHGYDANKYFADGEFTTGSGGRALTAAGIIVLQMADSADDSTTSGTREEGPDHLRGFESAVEQLSADNLVDTRRVGVIGFSRSCYHVLYALTHKPDLFAAASITDGLNMGYLQYLMVFRAEQEIFEKVNGGLPFSGGLSKWARSAPGFNLDKIKAPLLIAALERGELVAEWETYSGLRILKKPVDMIWLKKENAPHILVQPRQRYVSQQSAVDWYDFWLNGHQDVGPAKADQYARWLELRKLQEQADPNPKKQPRN